MDAGTVLAVAGLVLLAVLLLAVGVLVTVGNYEAYGPVLGYLLSVHVWNAVGEGVVVIARLVVALVRPGSGGSSD